MPKVKDIELIKANNDYKALINEMIKGKYMRVNESFYSIVDKSPVKDVILEYHLEQFVLNGDELVSVNEVSFTDVPTLEKKLNTIICGKVFVAPFNIPEFK